MLVTHFISILFVLSAPNCVEALSSSNVHPFSLVRIFNEYFLTLTPCHVDRSRLRLCLPVTPFIFSCPLVPDEFRSFSIHLTHLFCDLRRRWFTNRRRTFPNQFRFSLLLFPSSLLAIFPFCNRPFRTFYLYCS